MLTGQAVYKDGLIIIKSDKPPGDGWFDYVTTTNGQGAFKAGIEVIDPRRARASQRRLFFALLHDIWLWSGQDETYLKAYFYSRYTAYTGGKVISLADDTRSTVTDARELLDDVIDFIFEYQVPVATSFNLLPRDEDHFQYECIKHRQCLICGQHADIHHVDELGMGRNRGHTDHTQFRLAALCREHHQEVHQTGLLAFCDRYHLTRVGIKVDQATLKRIGMKGGYNDGQSKES